MEIVFIQKPRSTDENDKKQAFQIRKKRVNANIREKSENELICNFESLNEYLDQKGSLKYLDYFNGLSMDNEQINDIKRKEYYLKRTPFENDEIAYTHFKVAEYKQFNTKSNEHKYIKKILNDYENEINNNDNNNIYDIIDPCKYLYTYFTKGNGNIKYDFYDKNYYTWLPCVFRCDKGSNKCKLISNIVNVNQYKYKNNVYKCIEMVFNKMFYMFEQILGKSLKKIDLNVVVKCFDLCNNNDSEYIKYSHWNTISNNVLLYGLYVYDVNNIKDGNAIKLESLVDFNWFGMVGD